MKCCISVQKLLLWLLVKRYDLLFLREYMNVLKVVMYRIALFSKIHVFSVFTNVDVAHSQMGKLFGFEYSDTAYCGKMKELRHLH